MSSKENNKAQQKHKVAMQKQKAKVDSHIQGADIERGVSILLTGDGKGKTSSAFGMVLRALGYGQKVAVIQFIKGVQLSGEEMYLRDKCPEVDFYQMCTGFTWNTQDREADIAAAKVTWEYASRALQDETVDLVILDELTYMIAYKYLDEDMILKSIQERPVEQSVVVTGRGGGAELKALADTVSEVKNIKHAFEEKVKARRGVDY